jgi:FkbM family methyltransferase
MVPLRKLLKKPLLLALRNEWLRGKIVYELRKDFFRNLQIAVPLSHGMSCPLGKHDYIYSFSEIFIAEEYGGFLDSISTPRRWIDLGCHAGFFSLYLAWQLRKAGINEFSASLLDADPRVQKDVLHLIEANSLQQQFQFRPGMIGSGAGEGAFALREAMGSSADFGIHAEASAKVPFIPASEILKQFPPPYDLLKVDIEGAEFELVKHYGEILENSTHVLIEWHSWDAEASGESRLRQALEQRGFGLLQVLQERKHFKVEGRHLTAGCHLYQNRAERISRKKVPEHAAV